MRFYKLLRENLSAGMKVFANQIGIAVFALLLYTAVGSMQLKDGKDNVLFVCISAFSLIFYIFLIYTVVWEMGAKDRIRVDGGRAEPHPQKGLVIALAAELPNLFFGGIALILGAVAYATGGDAVKIAYAVFRVPTQLGLAGYMGIITTIFPIAAENAMHGYIMQSILYFVFPMILFPVLWGSYRLGYAEKRVLFLPTVGNKRK